MLNQLIVSKMQVFTRKQLFALEQGKALYNKFENEVKVATSGDYSMFMKKHFFFSSMPGYTKSHLIKKYLEEGVVPYYLITGKKSLRDFGYQLCLIAANHPDSPAIVSVDDSDFMFANSDSMNVIKNMMSGLKKFEYSNAQALLGARNLPKPMKDAVNKFKMKYGEGFSVPTHNIHFIIASNVKLPSADEAAMRQDLKPGPTSQKMVDMAAVADRMNNYHINFDAWEENWGYVAHRILEAPYFGEGQFEFTLEQRQQMVKFAWENFDKLKSKSFRLYEGLAQEMMLNPDDYLDVWNSSKFLNISQYK